MKSFARPIVVVSKCLGLGICRYDGERLDNLFIRRLRRHAKLVPICPEIEIGLGIPRERIDIVYVGRKKMLYQHATGRNLTPGINGFTRRFLASLGDVDGFILKSKSPSCGIHSARILDSTDPGARIVGRGSGFFAARVLERFGHLAIQDEKNLDDPRLRHHFLIKLFTLAAFHAVKKSMSLRRLARFHAQNQFLLTANNHKQTHILEQIVANPDGRLAAKVISEYELHLHMALRRPARVTPNIKILVHALDHFSEHLTRSERASFLRSLKRYREGKIPLTMILKTIGIWAVRYDKTYVKNQTFFRPYPGDLMDDKLMRFP